MENDNKGVNPTPFLDHAPKYWDMGLPVFPLKAGCKQPAIKGWQRYDGPPATSTQTKWLKQFPNANLGCVMGKASGLVVIDSDDPNPDTGALQEEFGPAGAIVRTASGKAHLFYAYKGEKKVIKFMGRNVDIIGDGGYVVLPPSVIQSRGMYIKIDGDWMGLGVFPTIKAGALQEGFSNSFTLPERIEKGIRDKTLYNELRKVCYAGNYTYESLLAYAEGIVHGHMPEPLKDYQVRSCVKSVWQSFIAGTLVPPSRSYAIIWELPRTYPAEAYKLFGVLKEMHGKRHPTFPVGQEFMAGELKVAKKTIQKSVRRLLADGYLELVREGGSGAGDPHIYCFGRGKKIPPIQ